MLELQKLSFNLFMVVVRPCLLILVLMLNAIYIDAFSCEKSEMREGHPSAADDLGHLVHDIMRRADQQVRFP